MHDGGMGELFLHGPAAQFFGTDRDHGRLLLVAEVRNHELLDRSQPAPEGVMRPIFGRMAPLWLLTIFLVPACNGSAADTNTGATRGFAQQLERVMQVRSEQSQHQDLARYQTALEQYVSKCMRRRNLPYVVPPTQRPDPRAQLSPAAFTRKYGYGVSTL